MMSINLTKYLHTKTIYFLWKVWIKPKNLKQLLRCVTDSMLTGCIAVQGGSFSTHNHETLHRKQTPSLTGHLPATVPEESTKNLLRPQSSTQSAL